MVVGKGDADRIAGAIQVIELQHVARRQRPVVTCKLVRIRCPEALPGAFNGKECESRFVRAVVIQVPDPDLQLPSVVEPEIVARIPQ